MCGIAGIASMVPVIHQTSLLAMRNTMSHRGPDDSGIWWSRDGQIGLAQQRLAVIDLSPAGHQPMSDASGRCWLAFNGEIYNFRTLRRELEELGHQFISSSDTEVILAAYREWGLDCLSRFNGMFAFALYDCRQRRLFIARDRAGEKPLYYRYESGRLVFASELKALMANPFLPRELDLKALDYYLTYGYVPGQMCMLHGYHKLPPAHALTFDLTTGKKRVWRYWQLPQFSHSHDTPTEELIAELEALLRKSVQLRMIADVPVGILLSGGIDSSLITALAAESASRPVKTFTITFPDQPTHDEGPFARQVADYFSTDHTELVAEPASVGLLPELARQFDEPMADSSMVPTYLISRQIRRYATVALGGDGGDELFGGYWHHSWIQRHEILRRMIPAPVGIVAGAVAARLMPVGTRGRNHLIGLSDGISGSLSHINMFFDAWSRRELFSPELRRMRSHGPSPEVYKSGLTASARTALQKATAMDFSTYLPDDLLVKVDRSSMLASLEVRAPWLDHQLIEFAFGRVPDYLRATDRRCKVLPRLLAERLLPSKLDLKRKQGFSLPLDNWFRGDWGRFMISVLEESEPQLFNRKLIRQLIAAQRRGYSNTQRLFALTMFELWRRSYRINLPSSLSVEPAGNWEFAL